MRCSPRLAGQRRAPQGDLHRELALLWQNVFAPLFFKDLFSAMRAPLRRRPKDEIDDGVTYGGHGWLRRRPVASFFSAPRNGKRPSDVITILIDRNEVVSAATQTSNAGPSSPAVPEEDSGSNRKE